MVSFDSQFYPYEKVYTGYNSFLGAQEIPYRVLMYLLDLPDKYGYEPADDNSRARVRLMKYLWHDGENPLRRPLPTTKEKLSILFDGNDPAPGACEGSENHPKGYRMFAQSFVGIAQTEAAASIKCYMGRVIPVSACAASIGITFEIFCNVNTETTTQTKAYARSYAIEQCIIEALNGVNMTGVGSFDFSRAAHLDNGSRPLFDGGTNVGRELKMSVMWMESESKTLSGADCD